MTLILEPSLRAVLDLSLDLLIPANPARDIPSAGALGVADFVLRTAQAAPADAAHMAQILQALQALDGPPTPDALRAVEQAMPEAFQTLLRLTYMGYYSRPDMREKVGVASWPVHPKGYDVPRESSALMDALTAPVRARGRIYRDAVVMTGDLS
ncbi:hypothetical protein [Pseudoruegeria sp. SK021]|uniref:hypothetical protein n=1 Tax=Pseudoruegeria sp. SK021 TaxID=1933035 RepID=UPI000A2289E4|nr:hypothetical protein [Pseudoruegeria sp. SK021]OSP55776.1 hypothetical protein BV911_05165 [Pseudoruegeria sp. SK021]